MTAFLPTKLSAPEPLPTAPRHVRSIPGKQLLGTVRTMALIERLPAATTRTESVRRLRAAVIGYGYWGPNLARNIAAHAGTELVAIGDLSPERLGRARAAHPWAQLTADTRALLAQPDIDAVVIATPQKLTATSSSRHLSAASTCWSRSRWLRAPPTPNAWPP